jgi:hypothetical protein
VVQIKEEAKEKDNIIDYMTIGKKNTVREITDTIKTQLGVQEDFGVTQHRVMSSFKRLSIKEDDN